jgi:hypothetical protein
MRINNNNSLREKIELLQKYLNRQMPYLNEGGCVHFAYFFSRRLTELNISYKIILLDYDNIKYKLSNNEGVSHVVVYIQGIGYIDGHETKKQIKRNVYNKLPYQLSSTNYIRKHYSWNDTYNVKQNRLLSRMINKIISEN